MALQAQEQETLNVKLVHFTKQNSPDEPVQVAFSVTDDQGKEEIITGEIPYSYDLFRLLQEQGWLNVRRGVSSIRETRQRRAMSAARNPHGSGKGNVGSRSGSASMMCVIVGTLVNYGTINVVERPLRSEANQTAW